VRPVPNRSLSAATRSSFSPDKTRPRAAERIASQPRKRKLTVPQRLIFAWRPLSHLLAARDEDPRNTKLAPGVWVISSWDGYGRLNSLDFFSRADLRVPASNGSHELPSEKGNLLIGGIIR